MGKHSADPVEEVAAPSFDRRRLLLLAAGVTATMVAWGYLVWLAIDFGDQARHGSGSGWFFLVLATIGATACMFLTLVLGTRALKLLRGDAPPPPRTTPGGRRAAR